MMKTTVTMMLFMQVAVEIVILQCEHSDHTADSSETSLQLAEPISIWVLEPSSFQGGSKQRSA